MLPQGLGNACTLSLDDGASFAAVALDNSQGVTALELPGITRWVSLYGPDQQITTSDNLGASPTDTAVIPDSSFTAAVTLFSDGPRAYIGGSNAAHNSPRIWETEDGTALTLATLPALTGLDIIRIDGGLLNGEVVVMAWTELGELIIRNGDGDWVLAADQPEGIPRNVAGNGAALILNSNEAGGPAFIVYSVDADGGLVERRRDTTGAEVFTGLAAMEEP